jgi:fatty aldehyde-generating acyl-ACP reductase
MKFATISHLMSEENLKFIPRTWFQGNLIISPELNISGTPGHVIALKMYPKQLLSYPREDIRRMILEAAISAQKKLDVELFQLGALTTSVTDGGGWLLKQKGLKGYVTHGDSYTASVTCQTVIKALERYNKKSFDTTLAIVGAYGIIGEAVSKILVPQFKNTFLIGPRKEKLKNLADKINGDFQTTSELNTKTADVIVTATSHPEALIKPNHLKKNAIVIDVSQPPNLTLEVCKKRPDIVRIDGGYVDFPINYPIPIPGLPPGKNYACIAEVIMQAKEDERKNHVGTIDIGYLKKTEEWGKKYGFSLNELTNFGEVL